MERSINAILQTAVQQAAPFVDWRWLAVTVFGILVSVLGWLMIHAHNSMQRRIDRNEKRITKLETEFSAMRESQKNIKEDTAQILVDMNKLLRRK